MKPRDPETYAIICAAMPVHREVACLLQSFGAPRITHQRLVLHLRKSAQSADKSEEQP